MGQTAIPGALRGPLELGQALVAGMVSCWLVHRLSSEGPGGERPGSPSNVHEVSMQQTVINWHCHDYVRPIRTLEAGCRYFYEAHALKLADLNCTLSETMSIRDEHRFG